MSAGKARTTLSTMVTLAFFDVRDIGFRSTVTTSFPILRSASQRSPSSNGTNTTSALRMPSGLNEFSVRVDVRKLCLLGRHQHLSRAVFEEMVLDRLFASRRYVKDIYFQRRIENSSQIDQVMRHKRRRVAVYQR